MLLLISPEQNFEEFFCLSHLGWSLWRSPLFLITCLSPRPLPPTIHAFPSSPYKTKAGSWKRSEVGKCIQWHRPDDSILRRPCNICFQPCLRAGTPCWAFCPTCSPHRAAVNGGLVQGHWSRNFSQPEQGGWAMRGVLRKTEKKVCRATSEVAMGRKQDSSRKTLSKEVVQGKKERWAALPSLILFLLHPLFCLSSHLVYLAYEAFSKRSRWILSLGF